MKILLAVLAILAFAASLMVFLFATSAIHEIEGLILVVVFAVFLSSAAILETLSAIRSSVEPGGGATSR